MLGWETPEDLLVLMARDRIVVLIRVEATVKILVPGHHWWLCFTHQ